MLKPRARQPDSGYLTKGGGEPPSHSSDELLAANLKRIAEQEASGEAERARARLARRHQYIRSRHFGTKP